MTATTNAAAEQLSEATGRPVQTIHSFLNLRVKDDYNTGETVITRTPAWAVHRNKVIIIDEASWVDSQLLRFIREGTFNCKIVFVGDHCQLTPIKEKISPIYLDNSPVFHLLEPMRNNGQPALMALCSQLRNTVETGVFNDIQIVPGVIDHLDDDALQHELNVFQQPNANTRVLAYTNERVRTYSEHIHYTVRGNQTMYVVGDELVSNGATPINKTLIRSEEPATILEVRNTVSMFFADGIQVDAVNALVDFKWAGTVSCVLPLDKDHLNDVLRYFSRQKNWVEYFKVKNAFPDLRSRDATTTHKAQGSTCNTVCLDLTDLSKCRGGDNLIARLLYVAVTRARNRVMFYGQLNPKYGKLIY